MDQTTSTAFDDNENNPYVPRTRENLMKRRLELSSASRAIQEALIYDYSLGCIDKATLLILREAFYQVLMAIDCHNTVWHIHNGGVSYPDNESSDNDWSIWTIDIISPIHARGIPVEGEDSVGF